MRISDWSSDVCSSDLPVAQVGQVVAAGDAELGQGALDAVLEHLLQAVPGVGGAFARLVDAVLDHVAHGVAAVVGELARGLLQVQAFLDQPFEQLGALGLGAAERADAGDRKSTRLNSS